MSRKYVVFVESNTTGTGKLIGDRAIELGYHPLFLVRDPDKYPFLTTHQCFEYQVVDTKDFSLLLNCLQQLKNVAAVLSTSEYFVSAAAALARELRLAAVCPESVSLCRDKFVMRQHLCRVNGDKYWQPQFGLVHSESEALALLETFTSPVVVKPRAGSGSSAVTLVDDPLMMGSALQSVEAFLQANGKSIEDEGVLIEEFIDGDEYSVEMFHGQVLGITQKNLSPLPYFVELAHYFPAPISASKSRAIEAFAAQLVEFTGLKWGPIHIECRLLRGKVYLLEINPRLAGGMIPQLIREVTDQDVLSLWLTAALGNDVSLGLRKKGMAAIKFFAPDLTGFNIEAGHPLHSMVDGYSSTSRKSLNTYAQIVHEEVGKSSLKEIAFYPPRRTPKTASKNKHSFNDFRDRVGHLIVHCADKEQCDMAITTAISLLSDKVDYFYEC